MKKLLILGAGTAGTMVANRLARMLDHDDWQITLVDQSPTHYYQPGFLFIPFGIYGKKDVVKPKREFIPPGVELISVGHRCDRAGAEPGSLGGGRTLVYDFLVIATGADIHPEQTPGLADGQWGKSIHTFYSYEGALALAEQLKSWPGGRLVLNVVDNPIKCPVAPLEFLMLADWYFHERGIRERVELIYATPYRARSLNQSPRSCWAVCSKRKTSRSSPSSRLNTSILTPRRSSRTMSVRCRTTCWSACP